MIETDRQLLQRLARGDMAALGALYDRHGARVYHVLLARGLASDEADEVLPEVFLALAERGGRLGRVENVMAYLLGIARHLAHRCRKRRPTTTPEPAAEEQTDRQGDFAAMEMLRQLPPEQAEVVALKVWHGYTFAEIGAALGIPANTAASRYRYGIEKLRGLWNDE